ncbi:enoyl-CoA hydratase-related protein [Haloarcula sp. 1CSR25-25]|jgi:enoyl-CoA hydratase/carnithine racemase|uniref:enoyl-CoA hydratase/isomerase family protein n=1 Tax=Haloarcula sp. 1CSR25-25 TaxID=2862545 RepID=UPI002894FA66|nr:enoyl-CoA hydratase-related protein [Haloarcula sp. 1CSR25-25]MDT3437737.1 enoyl-CoA hydratase/isomerase family protein [Haloarcula sp. 1CSR25-25]
MVRVEVESRVHTVIFDRPESKNAFTAEAARELIDALETATAEDARALVITGDGDAFCAGGDIMAMAERDERPTEAYDRVQSTLNTVIETILTAPYPVIAKINGDAVGAGTNIAAACDFAYAATSARFGEVFANVGLIPDSGGTFLLPALVGLRTAKELTMTGRLFDAEEAAEMDLINRVIPENELEESVDDLLSTLASKPTETLGLTKRGIHENIGRPFREALDREARLQTLAYGSEAHEIGVNAFLNDERPEFR